MERGAVQRSWHLMRRMAACGRPRWVRCPDWHPTRWLGHCWRSCCRRHVPQDASKAAQKRAIMNNVFCRAEGISTRLSSCSQHRLLSCVRPCIVKIHSAACMHISIGSSADMCDAASSRCGR